MGLVPVGLDPFSTRCQLRIPWVPALTVVGLWNAAPPPRPATHYPRHPSQQPAQEHRALLSSNSACSAECKQPAQTCSTVLMYYCTTVLLYYCATVLLSSNSACSAECKQPAQTCSPRTGGSGVGWRQVGGAGARAAGRRIAAQLSLGPTARG